jgi:hypothetical protein
MRVQSTRPILLLLVFQRAYLHKGEVLFVLCVFPSIKQRVSFCLQALQEHVLRWMKPPTTPLVMGTLADLTRGKAELLVENARLGPSPVHPASTSEATSRPKEGPTSSGAPRQDGSNLERGAFPCPAGDAAAASIVNSSVCSGSTNLRHLRGSRGSQVRHFHCSRKWQKTTSFGEQSASVASY